MHYDGFLYDRHTHTDTQTDRHRQTHTQTHTDTDTHTQTHTHTQAHTQTHTHRHTHTQAHTQTHTRKHSFSLSVGNPAPPCGAKSFSARRRTPGFAPRSPFGGPPLSPGASSMVGARNRRGLRFERLFPGIAVPRARLQVALSARAGDRVVRRQPQFGIPSQAASLVAQTVKYLPCKEGEAGLMPGSGRSFGQGNGEPRQYSRLEHPKGRGAWWATVHGIKE